MSDEQQIARPEDVPISTRELISALKRGRIGNNGSLTIEILEAVEIYVSTGPQLAIAVLVKVLRQRDKEIEQLKAEKGKSSE